MQVFRFVVMVLLAAVAAELPSPSARGATKDRDSKSIYVLPIRDDIMPPLTYLVRRGVKEAMDANADILILDMETNGGRVDVTEEIIGIIGKFKGETVTFVNRKAFSAGAFISVSTQKIYMAPQSVIGAAAPIVMVPGGGVEKLPDTVEAKMTSGVKALVRASARKNGYNIEVIEAMIDRTKELKIGDEVLNEKGQILTLTNEEAEKSYGDPPKHLLSSGTVESLDELIKTLGYTGAKRIDIKPTGGEKLATWINAISPILLIIGVVGIYIEFKTPGFGLPGIVGIVAFALYFFGGYAAGISDLGWTILFVVGLILVAVELFIVTGTVFVGLAGVALALAAIVMAMVDMYPGGSWLPTMDQLIQPLTNLMIATFGAAFAIWVLSKILPKTAYYSQLVAPGASGEQTVLELEQLRTDQQGQVGVALSVLRPGGKARFGDRVVDVISQTGMIEQGRKVRIIGHSAAEAIVEVVE